ncbi:hypothetical protein V8D89_004971 [Ganoderma adspersum]
MTRGHNPSTRGNKALAVMVFLLSMAPVVVNFAVYPRLAEVDFSYFGNCSQVDHLSPALAIRRMALAFLGSIGLGLILSQ